MNLNRPQAELAAEGYARSLPKGEIKDLIEKVLAKMLLNGISGEECEEWIGGVESMVLPLTKRVKVLTPLTKRVKVLTKTKETLRLKFELEEMLKPGTIVVRGGHIYNTWAPVYLQSRIKAEQHESERRSLSKPDYRINSRHALALGVITYGLHELGGQRF